jgi:hypothetical protein
VSPYFERGAFILLALLQIDFGIPNSNKPDSEIRYIVIGGIFY